MRRRGPRVTALAVAIAAALGFSTLSVGQSGEPDEQLRIRIGYQISPVPLQLHNRNRDLAGLGSYLVNAVAGCSDCHTQPPYAPGGSIPSAPPGTFGS